MPSGSTAPVRVLIVNTVALNAGDTAILLGEMRALREAYAGGVEITVADDAPVAAARLYPEIDFVPGLHADAESAHAALPTGLARWLRRCRISLAVRLLGRAPTLAERLLDPRARAHLARMRAADVVISTGGTYLVDHYPCHRRAHELLAAQALGRPTYLFTQSLGPFRKSRNRRVVGRALRGARRIFVRDARSREHLHALGVPADRIGLHPDAAFALAEATPPRRADGGLRVAISVRNWSRFRSRSPVAGRAAYRHAIAAAVRHLHRLGAEVTFVSTCQGVAEYWTDDARVARDLVDELLPELPGIRVDAAFRKPTELIEYLAGFDLAIATRMHFAILAMMAGVTVVPIAYEFKTVELFRGLGMEDLVEDIETITPAGLTRRLDRALDASAELSARIARALDSLHDDAAAPAREIRRRHPAPAADSAAISSARHGHARGGG